MGLNKVKKGSKMFSSVGWTWNPISGCKHGCKYCYAEALMKKWGKDFAPNFRPKYLKDKFPNDGTWIFVGSMGDLFCSSMKDEWILKILGKIAFEKTNNKFLLQTKNPRSFLAFGLELEQIKDKVILGTTIETTGDTTKFSDAPSTIDRFTYLRQMKLAGFKTFLSLEPLSDFDVSELTQWITEIDPEAIEIGLENYTQHTSRPSNAKICDLVEWGDEKGYTYILKENLDWVPQAIKERIQ